MNYFYHEIRVKTGVILPMKNNAVNNFNVLFFKITETFLPLSSYNRRNKFFEKPS